METILNEIRRALDCRLYFLSITMALALIDICAALESPDGETTKAKYIAWYEQWISPDYANLTGNDIYSLRCGVVHQGRFGHERMQYSRVVFTLPDGRGNVFHRNLMNDALNLDAGTFCEDILSAVTRWQQAHETDPIVQTNLLSLLTFHPNGLAPYFVGIPVIA